MRLRAGGLTDTPIEQPIPERWGGVSITLPTLPPPICQTSSVTTTIGRLCLTGKRQAAGPSLHLIADRLDFAEPLALLGTGWAARQDGGGGWQDRVLHSPRKPLAWWLQIPGFEARNPVKLCNLSPNLKGACVSSASGITSPFTHRNTESPSVATLKYLD